MTARGQIWSDKEVLSLITIWSDDHIQQQLEQVQRIKSCFKDSKGNDGDGIPAR